MRVLGLILVVIGSTICSGGMLVRMIQPVNAQPAIPQAEAPASILAATVADIPKGAKATVGPETLVVDENKKIWLNKVQPVGGEAGVTVNHHQDGTYEVEISDDKLRWLKVPLTDELRKLLIPVQKLTLPKPKGQ